MKYFLIVLTLCLGCSSKLKPGVYTAVHKQSLYGSETLWVMFSSKPSEIEFSQERTPKECPSLYQSFMPSEIIVVDIDSPMYKEKDSNNDPIFSFQPKHGSFPY